MRPFVIAAALGVAGFSLVYVPTFASATNGPAVSITSPAAGSTITSTDIPVGLAVQGFRLECADAGKPGRPSQGHAHVMLDGMEMAALTSVECVDHFSIAGEGIEPGHHTITVLLASDDHLPASKPVSQSFEYQPNSPESLPAPIVGGQPSISVVSPSDGDIVGKRFTLIVRVQNFQLSRDLEGKADVAGFGHLHVIVGQQGVTDQQPHDMMMPMTKGMPAMKPMIGMISMPGTAKVPVDLSTWRSGMAHITVMLATNDHMPAGAAPAAITVRLR